MERRGTNKLKKLGVLAVVLANFAIFAPQKAEGQKKSVDISNNPTHNYRVWVDFNIGSTNYCGCRDTGGNCMGDIVVTP